jgi:hypothetical protein
MPSDKDLDAQKQGSNKYKTKTLERRKKKKQGNNAKDRTVFGALYKVKDIDSEDYSSDNSNNNTNNYTTELTSDQINEYSDDIIINNNVDSNDPNTNFDIKPGESINEDESIDSLTGITEQLSLESTASINTTDTSNTSLLTVLEIQGAISEPTSPRDNENQNEEENDAILHTSDVINVDTDNTGLEKNMVEDNDAFDIENEEDKTPCDDSEINKRHKSRSISTKELLVDDVETKTVSSTFHLGDKIANLFDCLNLFLQISSLDEVSELGISMTVSHLVHVQEGLIDSLLKLKAGFDGLQGCSPFIASWLCNLTENNPSTSHVLVVNQGLSMLLLLLTCFAESLGKSKKSNVITCKVRRH